MLAVRRFGSGSPVVALHGFSLTGAQFSLLSLDGCEIVAPDLPGHGQSPIAPESAHSALSLVAETLKAVAPNAPVIGYSQGARIALTLAAKEMIKPQALVAISGTAGIVDPIRRDERVKSDFELAHAIVSDGVEAFVDRWVSNGLTATTGLSSEWQTWDRSIRLENGAAGLASALASYGQGAMPPVWDDLANIDCPVLLVTGREDSKYTTLGVRLAAAIGPLAELVTVNDAGHNPLADQPEATAAIIGGFLRQHVAQSSSTGTGDPLDQS